VAGRLEGKHAIVTGGGSGIGRAAALRFAEEGAEVAVFDLAGETAGATAEACGGRGFAVDVTDRDGFAAAVQEIGRVDVYFANAGVPQAAKALEETSRAEWDRIIGVNLTSLFETAQVVGPRMREAGGGSIVVTSSIAAARPRHGIAAYVASKAGVEGLVRALAVELAPSVRVNAIAPVAVRTPMLKEFAFAATEDELLARLEATIPLRRLTEPEDVAAAALYLASDEARCITGTVLNVDGGRSL
jgi:3-oxoacyl-[acyl-carrier protein] reductase